MQISRNVVLTGLVSIIFCFYQHVNGQEGSIKRSVISSMGGSTIVDSSLFIGYTVGQGHPTGTVSDSEILRQGFEQPKGLTACGILNNFIVESIETSCGTYYSFEYTGGVQENLVFKWDLGPFGNASELNSSNVMDAYFTEDTLVIIRLSIETEGGCQSVASKYIAVNGDGFASALSMSELNCESEEQQVIISPINGEAPFQIQWSDGATNFDRTILADGEYSYTISDAEGCTFRSSLSVDNVNIRIDVEANIDHANCDSSSLGQIEITSIAGNEPFNAEWSNGSTDLNIADLVPGDYQLTVFDGNGCDSIFDFTVQAECLDQGNFPNTFTPNGDNRNDTWVIFGLEDYPSNTLSIYNRWGSVVYEAQPYTNNWTGISMDGDELQVGVYYYVLNLNDRNNTSFTGSITIVK